MRLSALLGGAGILFLAMLTVVSYVLWKKQIHLWLGDYLQRVLHRRPEPGPGPVHIFLCVADHFEPAWNKASYLQECERVETWLKRYPFLASKHRDSDGRPPQHTFFYPEEEYRPEHLDRLARLCKDGYGDVEIHLHHDGDTEEGLREKLNRFKSLLYEKHGLLHLNRKTGAIEYGFIHGNWTLDNSGRDGKWCGVNNELIVLRETGCYADFTFPSAPSETQTRKVNSIYYALDDPLKPKSHDIGIDVEVGGRPSGDLMIIQGPLSLNWSSRKWGILPRIENGEISGDNPPTPDRADLWIRQHIHVQGEPNRVFVKLHTHGAQENNFEVLLGKPMDETLAHLETAYNDGVRYRLHYVTAKELYDIIKATESGESRPMTR